MLHHIRINTILSLLRQGPQTIESIAQHFNKAVSPRQIRSDIKKIKSLIGSEYTDFEKTGSANRKTWHIAPNTYDHNTERLSRGVLPQVFALNRYKSLTKLNSWLTNEDSPIIESTHFYETEAHKQLDHELETVIQAIDNCRKLILVCLTGDATSANQLIKLPQTILPIKIIYHRGCFYLAAVTNENQQVVTFQIDQSTFEKTNDAFDRTILIEQVETNLSTRFGVTHNMDDDIYDINLQFSSVTGRFVSEQFWHHTQHAKQIGDDWRITFQCGINRELVGWLFQWMGNVKIIGPPMLKELYNEQLARMIIVANQSADEPLGYNNIFAPKTKP